MLAVDYLRPAPVFCSEGGGCDGRPADGVRGRPRGADAGRRAWRASSRSAVVVAAARAAGRAWRRSGSRRWRRWSVALLLGGAVGPRPLLPLLLRGRRERRSPAPSWPGGGSASPGPRRVPRARGSSTAGRGSMLAAVLAAGRGRRGCLARSRAAVIRAEMARTRPAGQVTVVDFVDFECPYCRMTHAALEPILEAHRDRVRLVRRQVPLRMHPHALDAARAACCGERLGKGDAMASALFSAPVEQLTREGCEKIAQSVGLSPTRTAPASPTRRPTPHRRRQGRVQGRGWVRPADDLDRHPGSSSGAQPARALEQAIDEAPGPGGG